MHASSWQAIPLTTERRPQLLLSHTMHDHTTTNYDMLLQHSPKKKASPTSNIGALQLYGKRSHQINGTHLLKCLAAFCMLDSVGAATLPSSPPPKSDADVPNPSYNTV